MAVEKKMDCVILGLLSQEELTGYEIKKKMDSTLKYFWGASYGSIYPTLGNLVDRGLATRREGAGGRNKLIYAITGAGRQYLREWLEQPVERDELRCETMLKLFFGAEQSESQALRHIEAFQAEAEKELLYLLNAKRGLKDYQEDPVRKYNLLTVMFGIKAYCAYVEWCEEAKMILGE